MYVTAWQCPESVSTLSYVDKSKSFIVQSLEALASRLSFKKQIESISDKWDEIVFSAVNVYLFEIILFIIIKVFFLCDLYNNIRESMYYIQNIKILLFHFYCIHNIFFFIYKITMIFLSWYFLNSKIIFNRIHAIFLIYVSLFIC